jgi:hypothetical protein
MSGDNYFCDRDDGRPVQMAVIPAAFTFGNTRIDPPDAVVRQY